jgi:hypothetical protein
MVNSYCYLNYNSREQDKLLKKVGLKLQFIATFDRFNVFHKKLDNF